VRDDHDAYGQEVVELLRAKGIRASLEAASEPLGARVRRSKMAKTPYILVVGDDDVAARSVGVNRRGSADPDRGISVDDFVAAVLLEVQGRGRPEDAHA
jgi:threonyl-tRNA synthetase